MNTEIRSTLKRDQSKSRAHVKPGAIHEAGHAIAARHLGLPLNGAEFQCGRGGAARGWTEWLPCGVFDVYIGTAGEVAELRAAGRRSSFYVAFGANDDRMRIRQQLDPYLTRAQWEAYELKVQDDAAGFLYAPPVWEIIVEFARNLERRGSLTARQCMDLTEGVPQVTLAEIQHQMLDPVLHDHMGRRFGRDKRTSIEGALAEAVQLLEPAFAQSPPIWQMIRLLVDEGYSEIEIERTIQPLRDFWRKPSTG